MIETDGPKHPFAIRQRILNVCDVVMAVAAAVAISALCLEYGFYDVPAGRLAVLHLIEAAVLGAFVLDRLVRLVLAERRGEFLRENWIDFALIAAAMVAAGAVYTGRLRFHVISAAAVYVVITQMYILAALALRTAGLHVKVAASDIHPVWIVIGSFAVVILFGTGLLMLPKAAPADEPVGLADALFTATSATCVTGLIVRDTGTQFTAFGQVVILAMIQLGGLGIMIFGTVFALLAGRALSLRESLLAGHVLPTAAIGQIGRMVRFAVLTAVCLEIVAAAVMYPMWRAFCDLQYQQGALAEAGNIHAAFYSAFHAISAFCNAGFSLQYDSLSARALLGRWQVIGVMAPLIFLGGLGFPVLYDLTRAARASVARLAGRARPKGQILSLHSKLVLATSGILLVGGAMGLILIENISHPGGTFGSPMRSADNPYPARPAALAEMPAGAQVREAVFQSVTARTAGFNTLQMNDMSEGGKFWMCLLMIVGGSPASTAGGMKTITLAVLVLTIWCLLRRRERVEGFRRSIADHLVRKAVVLAGLYLTLILVVTLLLSVSFTGSGRDPTFMQVFFEACSACGTVGLSCGVTGSLSSFGKAVVIAAMFIGRLGPLTLLVALTLGLRPARYAYPSEEVVLG